MQKVQEIQHAIKQQSDDLREELQDLARWEEEIHKRDAAIRKKMKIEPDLPPVRGTPKEKSSANDTKKAPKEDPIQVCKEQGNDHFRRGNYEDAARLYTKGIDMDPESSNMYVLYGNRAMVYLKQKKWDLAERDANTCCQMNRTYSKGFYRRAMARKEMGKLKDARADLETCMVLTPEDNETAKELEMVTRQLHLQQEAELEARSKAGAPKKKKLIIEEVSDDDEDATGADAKKKAAEEEAKRKEQEDREREARHKQEQQEAAELQKQRAEERKKQAEAEELQRQRQRKVNPRVEVIDDDEEEVTMKKKPAAKNAHVDPAKANSPPKKAAASSAPARSVQVGKYTKENLSVPKNFTDFEHVYAALRANQKELLPYYFLDLVPVDSWPTIMGSSMTPEILEDVLAVAAKNATPTQAVELLHSLGQVRRLDEIMLFLEDGLISAAMENAKKAPASSKLSGLSQKWS